MDKCKKCGKKLIFCKCHLMHKKKCYVYIGEEDPPKYIPENFVDEDDLIAFLEANCRNIHKQEIDDAHSCDLGISS